MSVFPGLCANCVNVRVMRSDRESVFYLCRLSFNDLRFPKYPALPVLNCDGYVREPEDAGPDSTA